MSGEKAPNGAQPSLPGGGVRLCGVCGEEIDPDDDGCPDEGEGEDAAGAAPVSLAGFLAARLDEDEAAALDGAIAAPYVDRWLREVAAGRAILAQYEAAVNGVLEWGITSTLEESVMHLCAVYSDHPGYRDEWKP